MSDLEQMAVWHDPDNAELVAEIERLKAFARWVRDHSNDPGVVLKATATLEPNP